MNIVKNQFFLIMNKIVFLYIYSQKNSQKSMNIVKNQVFVNYEQNCTFLPTVRLRIKIQGKFTK